MTATIAVTPPLESGGAVAWGLRRAAVGAGQGRAYRARAARWEPRGWRSAGEIWIRSECGATWSGVPFRAITDDDLLRFFTVFQTVGMLG